MSSLEKRIEKLEMNMRIMAKALKLILEDGEELDPKELEIVKSRLKDWLEGSDKMFIDFDDLE